MNDPETPVIHLPLSAIHRFLALTLASLISATGGNPALRAEDITLAALHDATEITVGNLIYAGDKSSVCFADSFLREVDAQTHLNVHHKYVPTRLDSDAVFDSPFCVFSGEGSFSLTANERDNLRQYLTRGGFILASPGCSDKAWNAAFRREIKAVFPELNLEKVPMTHPIFNTVRAIPRLTIKNGSTVLVEGLAIDGRLALVYSQEGLNDVKQAKGCCCCGGDEIRQCLDVNINILTYALIY